MPKHKLTPKQKKYADTLLETGVGVTSALAAYDTSDYSTAAAISSENLTKPKVLAYLEAHKEQAELNIIMLANDAENEGVRLAANKDILDRTHGKPQAKVDITSGGDKITTNEAGISEIAERVAEELKLKKLS